MVFFTPNIESPTASFTNVTISGSLIILSSSVVGLTASNAVTASYAIYAETAGAAGTAGTANYSNTAGVANTIVVGNTSLDSTTYPLFALDPGSPSSAYIDYSFIYNAVTNTLYTTSSLAATASYVNSLNQILFITGGLNILNQTINDSLKITSGSTQVLTVTGSGVTVLGTLNSPSASSGGIYFDGSDFFLGF